MLPDTPRNLPPETVEGWYVLHQVFHIDQDLADILQGAESSIFEKRSPEVENAEGWSTAISLVGSTAEVMFMHFRKSFDEIGNVQRELARQPWMRALIPMYSFLSVTEAGLYYKTSKLIAAAQERGGKVGDEEYVSARQAVVDEELQNPHTRRRLFPPRPGNMDYVCFYPMSKKREHGQNWYMLTLDERNMLMYEHGMSGRRYAGRVQQVISGSLGFESWEWGVTLFSADPLEFKRIVTEMRFDQASARYGDFGDFFVGRMVSLQRALTGDLDL